MTQEVFNKRVLNAQIKTAYQFSDQILKPARYGNFNEDLGNKAKIQNQLLKLLWRFKIDADDNCACITEDEACDILNFLDNQIKTPYLPPVQPNTTTLTDESISYIFNLVSIGCDKTCVSDYRDIRVSLYTEEKLLTQYLLSTKEATLIDDLGIPAFVRYPLTVIDQDSVSISLYTSDMPVTNQSLFLKFEVMETEGVWLTIVVDHLLTILKQD